MAIAKEQLRQIISLYAIHYSCRDEGRIVKKAAYVALGVQLDGTKDILFFCVDGLPGFKEAIAAVYPQAVVQRCIIHMLRNSFQYLSYKDRKKFAADFKAVYKAPTEELFNLKRRYSSPSSNR